MSRSVTLMALVAAALSVAGPHARPVMAAPADITRRPDARIEICREGRLTEKCVARATGDFNGDGLSDVLLERFKGIVNADGSAQREFILLHAPFDRDGAADSAAIKLDTDRTSFSIVTVADVDRDGIDDLAFTSRHMHDQARRRPDGGLDGVLFRVAVVLGGPYGAAARDLHASTKADVVVDHMLAFEPGQTHVPDVNVAFGDFDADGRVDLAIGSGIAATSPMPFNATVEIMHAIDVRRGSRQPFAADTRYAGLGACEQSLAGAGDVTGDGIDDLIVRECPDAGLPGRLHVVAGSPDRAEADRWTVRAAGPIAAEPPAGPVADAVGSGNVDILPPPGRGYLGLRGGPAGLPGDPVPFFLTDLDGDGTDDILFQLGRHTHVWLGGPDIADRVGAHHTDRVIVDAGFGEMARTGGWSVADLTGDGTRDVLVTGLDRRPVGVVGGDPGDPRSPQTIRVFAGASADRQVLDLGFDSPDAVWPDPGLAVWSMADFNGDGVTDLLLGDGNSSRDSSFSIVFGPLGTQ